jgi:hypothetical protein
MQRCDYVQSRDIRKQLVDEQLAIFGILARPCPPLSKADREQVKRLAVGAIGTADGAAASRPALLSLWRFRMC